MDHQNIRFHNVEELEPVEGSCCSAASVPQHAPASARCAGKLLCHRH